MYPIQQLYGQQCINVSFLVTSLNTYPCTHPCFFFSLKSPCEDEVTAVVADLVGWKLLAESYTSGDMYYMVASSWIGIAVVGLGAVGCMTGQASLRFPLPAENAKGARKGALKIGYSTTSWSACRGWRVPVSALRTIRK